MEKQKEKELKSEIAKIYTKYHEASSSDRRQVYLEQLWEKVLKWCKSYIFYKKTKKMGLEIVEAVKRCVEREKMPPEEFLKYLGVSLYNARNQYYRDDVENSVKVTTKNKELKGLIKMWETEANRKLEQEDIIILISEWYCVSEKKARAYLAGNFISNTADDDNVKELDIFESPYLTPEKEAIDDADAEIIKNALETVLNEYLDKMEPIYRELFTIDYLKRNKVHQSLRPIFNAEILEMFEQSGKIPAQYEIYLKYHPNVKKSTAEANASEMSKKFLADINKAIKKIS